MKYFTSKEQFYNSKEWREVREYLKNKRQNEEGQLICQYCQKPIGSEEDYKEVNGELTKIGGAHLHHKIELTDENVNDINISLNENNLVWLHKSCHNELHDRFTRANKKIVLVVGAPCSGKSTWVNSIATTNDIILDFDKLCSAITINPLHVKNPRTNKMAYALRRCFLEQALRTKNKNNEWVNCYIITSEPLALKRKNEIINPYGIDEIVTMETTREECIKRLYKQNDNRDIAMFEKLINDFYTKYTPDE